MEARKHAVLHFGASLWNEARLAVNEQLIENEIVSSLWFSEDCLLQEFRKMDSDEFNDVNIYKKCYDKIIADWCTMMSEAALKMKEKAQLYFHESFEETADTSDRHDRQQQITRSKTLLSTAAKILGQISDRLAASDANHRLLYEIEVELLPDVVKLESGGVNTMELAYVLMQRTSAMMHMEGEDQEIDVDKSFSEALDVRSEMFGIQKLTKVKAKDVVKKFKSLIAQHGSSAPSLDLVSWVLSNPEFHKASLSAKPQKEKSKEEKAQNDKMLQCFKKFGLRSLSDAIFYLNSYDLEQMDFADDRKQVRMHSCR